LFVDQARPSSSLLRRGSVAALVALAAGTASLASASGPFAWLVPAAAPPAWKQMTLATGTAVLSVPPSLRRVESDATSVSAAHVVNGQYLAYLNATPQQGAETLAGWPRFRVSHLRDESAASVRTIAASTNLPFLGARGSCLIDVYVTKVAHHRFQELACFVKGATSASVIVAAAPASRWARVAALLERAVAAYEAR
jgi:hypothetical protein